jgi:N-carbamoylputrescine amidase
MKLLQKEPSTRAGRVGVSICYDRHYPEVMRALAVNGADLVIVPQAGSVGEWPEGLYEAEMRVAAFQNGYFVALCNRVGKEECLEFAGESFVCAPDGTVIARARTGTDEILYADIDLAACAESHARRLFLQHRRPDLYSEWFNQTEASGSRLQALGGSGAPPLPEAAEARSPKPAARSPKPAA